MLDDNRLEIVARNRGLRAKEGASGAKLLTVFLRKAEEVVIGRLIIEAVILLSVRPQQDGGNVLRAAAQVYKVDPDAIALKVKQEFAVTAKAKEEKKPQSVGRPERKRFA